VVFIGSFVVQTWLFRFADLSNAAIFGSLLAVTTAMILRGPIEIG
jgi:hypothetical protein